MPFSLTRVRLPQRRKDILRRPRLLDWLHRTLHRKLTFVSAPAGYGKTALLVDFAADVDATVCWYSIGSEPVELADFFQHLVAALQQRFPDFGLNLTSLLQTDMARDPRGLALELVNEMATHVNDFCVLMIDDYHVVGEIPAIVTLLEVMLDNLPDQVRLVLAGRSVYGIPAPRLYIRNELSVLNVQQLRFRADELQALVRQTEHRTLTDEQAHHLLTAADGWIAALLLASRSEELGAPLAATGAREHIFKFLADEVLAQQPAALQRLLLATALVEEFDESLSNYLLELETTGPLLHELNERNLFITQIGSNEEPHYRYHQLFAEFLRDRLWATKPEWARTLHRRAAEWFAQRERWEQAVGHWLAIGERSQAATLMDRAAPALYVAGRTELLDQWVKALTTPDNLLAQAPRLAIVQAKYLMDQGDQSDRLDTLLELAESRLQAEGDADQWANALITHGRLRHFQNRFPEALALAQQAEAALGEARTLRWYQIKQLEAACAIQQDDLQTAIAQAQIAMEGFRRLGATYDLSLVLSLLALAWWQQENLFETQRCLVEALAIRRQLGHRITLVEALNNLAYLYHQTGRYAEAWQLYEEAFTLAQTTRATRDLAFIQNGRGDFLCEFEMWDEALAAYTMAREINEALQQKISLANTYQGLADLERRRRRFNEAQHWWREAARVRGEDVASPRYQAGLGAIYLDMGQHVLAREALSHALALWEAETRFQQEHALAHLRLAQIEFVDERWSQALEQLGQALNRAARFGNDQILVSPARRARELLIYAVQQWPDHAQLRSLLERIEQFQPGLAQFSRGDTTPVIGQSMELEVLAFGPGRVRRNGELLPTSAWTSSRSRALFIYIAEHGQASKDEIALNFWPDYSPEKISSNFHATLWRIRRALGPEVLRFSGDQYGLSPSVNLWYDVAEFEAHLQQAASVAQTEVERAERWRQAIALYQDEYLKGITLEWANQRRTELQMLYIAALSQLADWECSLRHYDIAQSLYEKIIRMEPYHDEVHAGLMDCLVWLGQPNAARSHYLAYEKQLRIELNTEPPLPLRERYEKLRHLR